MQESLSTGNKNGSQQALFRFHVECFLSQKDYEEFTACTPNPGCCSAQRMLDGQFADEDAATQRCRERFGDKIVVTSCVNRGPVQNQS